MTLNEEFEKEAIKRYGNSYMSLSGSCDFCEGAEYGYLTAVQLLMKDKIFKLHGQDYAYWLEAKLYKTK